MRKETREVREKVVEVTRKSLEGHKEPGAEAF